jgi:redox-sensitive bicupin YhaK (pirin superfamily)
MSKTVFHKADSRGYANYGWLETRHTFSFARYFDPTRMNFGALRVLNDDIVAGGQGFGEHGHDNMEIVSIPLYGALAHGDSTGTRQTINPGEVQIMSAGSGITHSEFNASTKDPVNFLQIWVMPAQRNIKPRYDQRLFSAEEKKNNFCTVVSPNPEHNALWINQDAYFSLGTFDASQEFNYNLHKPGNGAYIFIISGKAKAENQLLEKRDGFGISDLQTIGFQTLEQSEILIVEVPMSL